MSEIRHFECRLNEEAIVEITESIRDELKEHKIDSRTRFFLENPGLAPAWSYINNRNVITIDIPRNNLRNETLLILSAAASVISGIVLPLLPQQY